MKCVRIDRALANTKCRNPPCSARSMQRGRLESNYGVVRVCPVLWPSREQELPNLSFIIHLLPWGLALFHGSKMPRDEVKVVTLGHCPHRSCQSFSQSSMIAVASLRPLTSLEVVLLQVLTLGAGLSGSFWLGRSSAAEAARDVIRPHARSALRTILALRDSLFRLIRAGLKILSQMAKTIDWT